MSNLNHCKTSWKLTEEGSGFRVASIGASNGGCLLLKGKNSSFNKRFWNTLFKLGSAEHDTLALYL